MDFRIDSLRYNYLLPQQGPGARRPVCTVIRAGFGECGISIGLATAIYSPEKCRDGAGILKISHGKYCDSKTKRDLK
jgi:hypothetical protein